jgi:hypothetical protein
LSNNSVTLIWKQTTYSHLSLKSLTHPLKTMIKLTIVWTASIRKIASTFGTTIEIYSI